MSAEVPAPPSTPPGWATRGGMTLDRLATGMFFLLAVEFVLGVALGLFVALPSGVGVAAVLTSSWVLDLHILVALLIVGISIRALVLSIPVPRRTARFASSLALGSSLIATISGWAFAFDGQSPDASFAMALAFLGVLIGAFLLRGLPAREGRALDPSRLALGSAAVEREVVR
jgi:hypothetical protein